MLYFSKSVDKPIIVCLKPFEQAYSQINWVYSSCACDCLLFEVSLKLVVEVIVDKRHYLVFDLCINLRPRSLIAFYAILSQLLLVKHQHLTLVNSVFKLLNLFLVISLKLFKLYLKLITFKLVLTWRVLVSKKPHFFFQNHNFPFITTAFI